MGKIKKISFVHVQTIPFQPKTTKQFLPILFYLINKVEIKSSVCNAALNGGRFAVLYGLNSCVPMSLGQQMTRNELPSPKASCNEFRNRCKKLLTRRWEVFNSHDATYVKYFNLGKAPAILAMVWVMAERKSGLLEILMPSNLVGKL